MAGQDTVVVALDIAGAFDRVWHGGLLEKLRAKGIQGDLLLLLGDYLQGRTLQVVVNGQASSPASRSISPTGSVLGPFPVEHYVDDLLQQLPAVSARHRQWWGFFGPRAGPAVEGEAAVWWRSSPTPGGVKVLGVEVGRELRFDGHIKHIAKKASHRVFPFRRVARFPDRGGKTLAYKAQIRALLRVRRPSWMSCAARPHSEAGQHPASSPATGDAADPPTPPDPPALFEPVSPLDHWNTAGMSPALVVFHKAQVQGVPHLAGLRQPPRVATRSTRTVSYPWVMQWRCRVPVPASTKRTLGPRSRMWNIFTAAIPHIRREHTKM
ncbi:hypothetical protein GWK47_048142 [Chionoecetes opilio]|uniref:Reverse transcriptase domain-containing protein n=1 Tax=Chionoecetes opilio TaxID=41210 RepID=A0A8J5CU21_CHIOP|nr:hypothetical protein GWK47_048142 [Chionoecetes opilio]